MPTRKASSASEGPADPDKLVRKAAGIYRTADERFEVRGGGTGWFLVDTEQANEFGQELMLGPLPTLDAVREAIPSARTAKVTPIRRARSAPPAATRKAKKARPAPPPPSWIERLPKADATAVRRLIAALEADGIGDAEDLVRRDREGIGPAVATRLIERRLAAIVNELPEAARPGARELLGRVAAVLTAEGQSRGPLPGWSLVEIGPEPEPANRAISIRELPD
jgi:hypothetical protein